MVFQCINIHQVPREVLKTAASGLGFQHLPRDLANVNAWKTMFVPYNKQSFAISYFTFFFFCLLRWLGEANVSCSFCHRGAQLILAYSWARPAVLATGKGRGGMLLFLWFLHLFLPYLFLHLLYYLFYLFSPFLCEMTQNDPQGLPCR